MLYRIHHTTTYTYAEPVSLCHNLVHLTPRPTARQECLRTQLLVTPLPDSLTTQLDYFGNATAFFTLQKPHRKLEVTAQHLVRVEEPPLPSADLTPPWEDVRRHLRQDRTSDTLDAYQFAFPSGYVPQVAGLVDYAAPSFPAGRPLLEGVLDLTRRIHADFKYDRQATTVATPLQQVLDQRRGVCQDFAHLEIGCLRGLGLAARYVSGYLLTTPPPGKPKLIGADASHAWVSVYCPGWGWLDVDPTNDLIPSEKHIVLAWGRDYEDVSPVKGIILGGGPHTVGVAVDVALVEEPAS